MLFIKKCESLIFIIIGAFVNNKLIQLVFFVKEAADTSQDSFSNYVN